MIQLNEIADFVSAGYFNDPAMIRPGHVWIIDNDKVVTHLSSRLMEKSLFCEKIATFTNGLQALGKFRQLLHNDSSLPDMVLIDPSLPVTDGWKFCEELAVLSPHKKIPVFIFTFSIDPGDMEKARNIAGITGFVPKPLTIHGLDKILGMMAGNISREKALN
jgi:CheY-like chemotaxis protein